MTISPVSFLLLSHFVTAESSSVQPLSHFVTAPLEKWSSPVAQAKRSDGGVLKVEQPGGPLAVEEFIKGAPCLSLMGAV